MKRLLLALVALLGLATPSWAQLSLSAYHDIAWRQVSGLPGFPASGATITVCAFPGNQSTFGACSNTVTIYGGPSGVVAPNPFNADNVGNYSFWAPAGNYTITVTGSNLQGYAQNISIFAGSPLFSGLLSSTNTQANMVVGSGASLSTTGTGQITANQVPAGNTNPANCTPTLGQLFVNTSGSPVLQLCGPGANTWSSVGSGSPGGTTTQTQVNNGGLFGGTACQTFPNLSTGPVTNNCDTSFKGLNPYVDARVYGVRAACNFNITPCASGITATTTGGLATVTISGASSFQNNDGVVVLGAGAANGLGAMSAPTVAPFNARGPTGTGDGVAAPAGATTYNYKVFACDVGGGCTAASAAGSTSTGAASLGNQNQTSYAGTRSNDTWTYAVGSQPAFSAGTLVDVDTPTSGVSDADFQGYYKTATVTGTGFTVTLAPGDTRNGSRAASTGTYTVHWWNYNKVTWTAPTGSPYRYFICSDRQTPGTYHVLGQALLPTNPKNPSTFTDLTLEFDDFGQTMMAQSTLSLPWYVSDANCTGAATNDNWGTTIASGAGTTTLTMSGNAPNSVTTQTIRFDNTQPMLNAVAAAGNAPVALPVDPGGLSYVFNSVLDIAQSNVSLMLPQGLVANDTIFVGSTGNGGGKWFGNILPGRGSAFQFATENVPVITIKSSPGVFNTGGNGTFLASDLAFSALDNAIAVLQDGGGANLGAEYHNDNFLSGSSNSDFMGMAFVCRGAFVGSCAAAFTGRTLISSGSQAMNGTSSTPGVYCDYCSNMLFDHLMGSSRAIVFDGNFLRVGFSHWQGGSTPFVHTVNNGRQVGNLSSTLVLGELGGIVMDTMGQPGITNTNGTGGTTAFWYSGTPSSSISIISGQRLANFYPFVVSPGTIGQNRDLCALNSGAVEDGIFNPPGNSQSASYLSQICQSAFSTGTNYAVFVGGEVPMAAPTAVVAAGGSIPVGSHTYAIRPVWQDGAEGALSPLSAACVTSSGNQTCNLTWTPVTGNCKGYDLVRDGLRLQNVAPQISGCATSSFSDTAASAGSPPGQSYTASGPTVLRSTGLFSPQVQAAVIAGNGVPCTNAELALSAGWQSTGSATVTSVAGTGITCSWTITTGTTTAANPTVTDTLTNPLPNASIVCEMNIHGGTHTAAAGEGFQQTSLSATAPVFTFNGTPTAGGTTYLVTRSCGP